jgi:hypothetical protein
MQTPKDKFSVGSLFGVFGIGSKGRDAHFQKTIFSDTLHLEFQDTSTYLPQTSANDDSQNPSGQAKRVSGGDKN